MIKYYSLEISYFRLWQRSFENIRQVTEENQKSLLEFFSQQRVFAATRTRDMPGVGYQFSLLNYFSVAKKTLRLIMLEAFDAGFFAVLNKHHQWSRFLFWGNKLDLLEIPISLRLLMKRGHSHVYLSEIRKAMRCFTKKFIQCGKANDRFGFLYSSAFK